MIGGLGVVAEGLTSAWATGTASAPPGLVLGVRSRTVEDVVARGFRTVHASPEGIEGRDAMTTKTSHDLASVTKVVATTIAILRLVSDRLVDLEADVRRYLPAFEATDVGVTVRDLLQHRAGLWEWQPLYLLARDTVGALRLVDRLPTRYEPRTAYHYSDLGFILLGRIVEAATGLGLEDAIAELVTRPFGLSATQYRRPIDDDVATGALDDRVEIGMLDTQEPFPVGHSSGEFRGWRTRPVHGEVSDGNAFHAFGGVSGHAGLFSTVPDLLRFAHILAAYRDHDDLWRPEVAESFFAGGPDGYQGLGFRRFDVGVEGAKVTVVGHTGFVGCAVGFIPDRDVGLALATNRLLVSGSPPSTEDLWMGYLRAAADSGMLTAGS